MEILVILFIVSCMVGTGFYLWVVPEITRRRIEALAALPRELQNHIFQSAGISCLRLEDTVYPEGIRVYPNTRPEGWTPPARLKGVRWSTIRAGGGDNPPTVYVFAYTARERVARGFKVGGPDLGTALSRKSPATGDRAHICWACNFSPLGGLGHCPHCGNAQ